MVSSNYLQSGGSHCNQELISGPEGDGQLCEPTEYGDCRSHTAAPLGEWDECASQGSRSLPHCVWIYLFERTSATVLSTRDLYSIIQVCKSFYGAALRLLYRHLIWCDPARFIASLPRLREDATAVVPLSLHIACSILPPSTRPFTILYEGGRKDIVLRVGGDFRNILHTIQPQRSASHFVTIEVFSRMVSIAKTFIHLEKLSLANHIISGDLYGLLGCFPHLRSLTISSCHFETESSVSPRGFIASYHLQELSFRNITYKPKPDFAALVTAPNLSSLCFDRTSGGCLPISGDAYKKLTFLQIYDTPGWTLSGMLPQDTVAVAIAIAGHSLLVEDVIIDIPMPFPSSYSVPLHLSRSLRTYRGPAHLLLEATSRREFREIVAVEVFDRGINLEFVFSSISFSIPGLQRLVVSLENWDQSLPDVLLHLTNLGNLAHISINVDRLVLEDLEGCLDRLFLGLIPLAGLRSFHFHQRSQSCLFAQPIRPNFAALSDASVVELCFQHYGTWLRDGNFQNAWRLKDWDGTGSGAPFCVTGASLKPNTVAT